MSSPFSAAVNPLAAPKGVKQKCELCQKPARVQCMKCHVTFYCGNSHQQEDWSAIHEKICGLVNAIHNTNSHASTNEERLHYEHQQTLRKKYIIDIALQEGKRLLYTGQASFAIPAALQAVRYLTELIRLSGDEGVEGGVAGGVADIAPAYLILSEAAILLGRLSEAEQYLSQVQWQLLQCSSAPPSLLASLHRNLGQLATARGKLQEARRHFSEDVYQNSVAHGTESPYTAGGYFHMAAVFIREGRPDIAASLHDQVIEIWYNHLSTDNPQSQQLGVNMQAEALYVLQSICDLRQRSSQTPPTSLLYHTLALIYHITKDHILAIESQQRALDLCSHGDDLYPTLQTFMERLKETVLP